MAVTSLANLMQGNSRFVAGTLTHPHEDSGIRTALVSGQHPHAIVLSCSDSRVPPEVIFDQGLGDLFVVRAAGHVLDHATVASVEYAIEHLHAPLVLVLGHQGCGAVKTALTTAPEAAGSPDLKELVAAIRPAVAPFAAQSKSDPLMDKAVRANVEATLAALMKRSAIVRGHVAKGQLTVVPSIYELASGEVEMWDAPAETTASGEK
jgi:carbonic anhydrase